MLEKKLVPKLRFSEYTNDWKIMPLNKFIIEHKGGAPLRPRDFIKIAGCEVIPKKAITSGGELKLDQDLPTYCTKSFFDNYEKSVVNNTFLITTLRDLVPSGPNIGYIVKYTSTKNYLLAQGVYGIKINIKNLIEDFLIQYSNTSKYRKLMQTIMVGSTQVHIRNSVFFSIDIPYTSYLEQQKIASFLSEVDTKLSQLTKKKALLENYKKGVMQKIFSQELRFKDGNGNDYGDWEEKKIKSIAKVVGGGTPSTTDEDFWNGDINWFTPTEIKYNSVSQSNRKITALGLSKSSATILPKGTILLTTRATIGEVAIANEECTTNQGFQSLVVNKRNSNLFVFNLIKIHRNELYKRANGSTFKEISKKEIEKIEVSIPCLEEQTKIANFLGELDAKIEVLSTSIENTQTFKKGLLQQLFV
jgi:type I restriction enzyme S subunit